METEIIKNINKSIAGLIIEKAKKKGSKYINPDGTFKGGFDGCVSHFTEIKGLKKENAERLCAYIGRGAGKIK